MAAALGFRTAAITCLRLSLLLSQALRRARSRKKGISNYFTCQFKANYHVMSRGLVPAILNPCTHLFAFTHVLLLACILCPASRLLNIDTEHCIDHGAWRRLNRLLWIHSSRSILSRLHLILLSILIAELVIPPQQNMSSSFSAGLTATASLCLIHSHQLLPPAREVLIRPQLAQHRRADFTSVPHVFNRQSEDLPIEEELSKAFLSLSPSKQASDYQNTLRRKLIIDSGASFHVHPHSDDMTNLRPCSNRIMGIDHNPHNCSSIGDLPIKARGDDGFEYNLVVKNVRCAPTFKDSLISINQLWLESKVDVSFKDVCCLVTPCGKRLPFDRPKGTGLYTWRVLSNVPKQKKHVHFNVTSSTSKCDAPAAVTA